MIQSKKLILFWSLLALSVFAASADEDEDEDEDDVILSVVSSIISTPENSAPYFPSDPDHVPIGLNEDTELVPQNDEHLNTNTTTNYMASKPLQSNNKWPKTIQKPYQVIVPIQIREEDYTAEALANFRAGLDDIENKTCVRFVDRLDRHKDFIFVHDAGEGKCSSMIGKVGGKQPLKLTNGCMLVRRKCVHEIIHALGFNHMHQRHDRNTALTMKWENIAEKDKKWFTKYENEWEAYNTPYDLWSCMHYGKNGFSKNGEITIQTINTQLQDEIGKQFTLSAGDAQRIVRMYRCPGQYWTSLSQ